MKKRQLLQKAEIIVNYVSLSIFSYIFYQMQESLNGVNLFIKEINVVRIAKIFIKPSTTLLFLRKLAFFFTLCSFELYLVTCVNSLTLRLLRVTII